MRPALGQGLQPSFFPCCLLAGRRDGGELVGSCLRHGCLLSDPFDPQRPLRLGSAGASCPSIDYSRSQVLLGQRRGPGRSLGVSKKRRRRILDHDLGSHRLLVLGLIALIRSQLERSRDRAASAVRWGARGCPWWVSARGDNLLLSGRRSRTRTTSPTMNGSERLCALDFVATAMSLIGGALHRLHMDFDALGLRVEAACDGLSDTSRVIDGTVTP